LKNATPQKNDYISLVERLTELIETEYPDGGKLPSSREMCQQFNTTLTTYGKAVTILRRNGLVHTAKGRGGTFANPSQFRLKKVGILLASGTDSPFLVHPQIISSLVDQLTEQRFGIQLIQGNPEGLAKKVILHDIQVLIAVDPDPKMFAVLKAINQSVPVIGVSIPLSIRANLPPDFFPLVSADKSYYYRLVFESMKARNHKKIMLVSPFMKAEYDCIREAAKEFGLKTTHANFVSPSSEAADLRSKFDSLKPTVILVEGRGQTHVVLGEMLKNLPERKYPEILVHYQPGMALYRKEKIIGLLQDDNCKIGEAVASMIGDYFRTGTLPSSFEVEANSLLFNSR
jgi:hypothetical protein